MNIYFVNYPRGFANEYTVYVVDSANVPKVAPDCWNRISRPEAIRLAESRPREAKSTGEQWFGGWCNGNRRVDADTLGERIDNAKRNSHDYLGIRS